MFTTARLADRMPATYSVMIGPALKKTSPIWLAMPIGPETGGGAVGFSATDDTRSPSPPTIRPIQRRVSSAPTWTAVHGSFVRGRPVEVALDARDPQRAVLGVDRRRVAERHRRLVTRGSRRVDGQRDLLPGLVTERDQQVRAGEELESLAVDRHDRVAALEPRGRGRQIRLDLVELRADVRRGEPRDAREDREREHDVHDDARDEDQEPRPQRLRRERARVALGVAVFALELDEPTDRQPVQRVERLPVRLGGPWPVAGTRSRTRARGRWPAGRRRSGRARG